MTATYQASCPFCTVPADRVVAATDLTVTIRDAYPVSPGHTLVITRRHVETFFEATADEQAAVLLAVALAKVDLDREHQPAGYNIGINVGVVAGQTVMHVHVHVIPRYPGDVADPRGGVRHVIPGKGYY